MFVLGVSGGVVANWVSGIVWVHDLGLAVFLLCLLIVGALLLRARWYAGATVDDAPLPALADQPEGSPAFAFQESDVAAVADRLAGSRIVAVVGRRGIGTSSCARAAASLARERYPGRYLAEARMNLRWRIGPRFLGTWRHSDRWVRTSLAATVADLPEPSDQDILLVVDNVGSVAQLRQLLPPPARVQLLLAGSPILARRPQVTAYELGEPDCDEAVALFAAAADQGAAGIGPAADFRGPAARDLVDLCGRQPRAVWELGYWMARYGQDPAEVRDRVRGVLALPAYQDVDLPDVLRVLVRYDIAYRAASPPARRLFRLMALAGAPLDERALAALAGRSRQRLRPVLEELVDGRFIEGSRGSRYVVRPSLADCAWLHLLADTPRRGRVGAQVRLLRHLTRRAKRYPTGPGVERSGVLNDSPGLYAEAMYALILRTSGWASTGRQPRWGASRALILHISRLLRVPGQAGRAGMPARRLPRRIYRQSRRAAMVLCSWYARRDQRTEWAKVCNAMLAFPRAGRDPDLVRWANNELGVLCRRNGDPAAAEDALTTASDRRVRRGQAQVEHNLGLTLLDQGRVEEAIDHLKTAANHRGRADRPGQARTALALGAAHLVGGWHQEAHQYLRRAADVFADLDDVRGYAAALTNDALAQWWLGEHVEAAQAWTGAVEEYDKLRPKDPAGLASALLAAGAVLLASAPDRAVQARDLLARGLDLRKDRPPGPGLARTYLYLGDALSACGDQAAAREHWQRAAVVAERVGDRDATGAARQRLAGT